MFVYKDFSSKCDVKFGCQIRNTFFMSDVTWNFPRQPDLAIGYITCMFYIYTIIATDSVEIHFMIFIIVVGGMFNRFKQNIFKQVTVSLNSVTWIKDYLFCPRALLQSRGGLEQVLVVVVDVVQVVLQQRLLGDLPEHLVHHGVGDVVPQEVQHETVSSTELQVL